MKFIITPRNVGQMSGSLHIYHNYGRHNYNDFYLVDIINVIYNLYRNFNIDPRVVNLNHVEIGVNIELPYCPDEFVNNLITHKYQQFNVEENNKMTIAKVKRQQFQVKIYNKGLQYKQDKNILRFEVKVKRMVLLKKYGIQVLWDLMDPNKLDLLRKVLLDTFNDLTYWDDSINMESLSKADRILLQNGRNPKFWKEHLALTRSNASKNFRKYKELVDKNGSKHFYEIGKLINEKWDSLVLFTEEAKLAKTKFQRKLEEQEIRVLTENREVQETSEVRVLTENMDEVNDVDYKNEIKHSQSIITRINNLNIGGKVVSIRNDKKVCKVTGLDISMQKDSSRFLSTTGIKYIYNNNPYLFKDLQLLLTENWRNAPLEKQVKEIAHTIRNIYHSKRIHTQKAIKRLCITPALFNNYDLISQRKKSIAFQK